MDEQSLYFDQFWYNNNMEQDQITLQRIEVWKLAFELSYKTSNNIKLACVDANTALLQFTKSLNF
jgi:hypothetical protein